MSEEKMSDDLLEQARQHVASFEAIGGTVAYPFSVRLAKRVISLSEARYTKQEAGEVSRSQTAQALEEAAKAVEGMRPCPFDKGQPDPGLTPDEPCPVCGDLGNFSLDKPSNCQSASAIIRALKQEGGCPGDGGWRDIASAPKGWMLVPVEPTEQMVEDGRAALSQGDTKVQTHARVLWVWEAMLKAAPHALKQEGGCPGMGDGGWRDIASAPKDGRKVLVCDRADYRRIWVACWCHDNWEAGGKIILNLTDWQPLPTPPSHLSSPTPANAGERRAGKTKLVYNKTTRTIDKVPASPPLIPGWRDAVLRNALLWTFDRLSIDGGMTVKEQRRTMLEIGNVLRGRPSPAATYHPNDWDESASLKSPPPVDEGGRKR